ncbi:MAG: RIP metalloprotease RseP [Clostridiales bacterium]|nr:RIP metalloprotease RseP [Clostridiales bacterium]
MITIISILNLSISISTIWSKVWPVLVAILFFGLIIAIHELGHFVSAKIFHVKVNEFSLGMGPAIFKRKKGDTQYSLRCLPIGGFVSMEGEDETSDDEGAFCKKKPYQKFIITAAGAIMNLILGFIFVIILTCMDDLIGTTQIHSFYDNATSASYGLQEGDIIKKINGTRIFSSRDISYSMLRDEDGIYDFVVERDGETVEIDDVHFETETDEDGQTTIIYDFIIVGVEKTPLNVITTAAKDTVSIARLIWLTLFDLVTGHYGINDLSGPVGTVSMIAEVTSEAASAGTGFDTIVYIMALITINIGVFNLLPIPALDGGRLFFIIIEGIRRKPIPAKYEGRIHAVGLALLMLFMVVITFNDIKNLITGVIMLL